MGEGSFGFCLWGKEMLDSLERFGFSVGSFETLKPQIFRTSKSNLSVVTVTGGLHFLFREKIIFGGLFSPSFQGDSV